MRDVSKALLADLSARGIVLRAPAREQDILGFERAMGLQLDHPMRELYGLFNGFVFADHRSQIFLWGLDEIARRTAMEPNLRHGNHVAIGDFLIDSDFLVNDLGDDAPVTLLFEEREIARGVVDLVERLGAGHFDFLAFSPEGQK